MLRLVTVPLIGCMLLAAAGLPARGEAGLVRSPEVSGVIGKDDQVRIQLDARQAIWLGADTGVVPDGGAVAGPEPITMIEVMPVSGLPPVVPAASAPAGPRIVLGWQFNPDTVTQTTDAMTVLAPVWFSVTVANEAMVLMRRRASRAYVDEAHRRGYRVWPVVQMLQSADAHAVLTRPELAAAARAEIVAALAELGADGVNLDVEYHPSGDSLALTVFAAELGAAVHARGMTLSVCVTRRARGVSNRYDRAGLARVADYIALMAYDQHWSTCPENGPVAALDWVAEGVRVTLAEVPPAKLLLGMPLYAFDWVLLPDTTTAAGEAAAPAIDSGGVRYLRPAAFRALTLDEVWNLAADGITATRRGDTLTVQTWLHPPAWSDSEQVMYMAFTDVDRVRHEIWFENVQSLIAKQSLIDTYGLAGAALWQLQFIDRDGLAWRAFSSLNPEP
ncbi:MAG TPA: glycosyl hydrolase family 18 protein [bacterium]|nr:glycosyl hydrolase family 18 protein [bacterium]